MRARHVFMPLVTYPEPIPDPAILAAIRFAAALRADLSITAYAVEIPQVSAPLGGMLLDLPGLAHAAENKSRADADRLLELAMSADPIPDGPHRVSRTVVLGGVNDAAVGAARLHDLTIVPMARDAATTEDLAQALVFGAGRPIVLVPASFEAASINHVAIAWDGSRVAARALADALPLLAEGGEVTVLTVADEKPLGDADPAGALAALLQARGWRASARRVSLDGRPIGAALQDAALECGARLLAMGGFGHSRLRDFVLGGATTGVLADPRIATLISH